MPNYTFPVRWANNPKLYGGVAELQADLGAWLVYYNSDRSHQGYRTLGRRPLNTVSEFLPMPGRHERCLTQAGQENPRQEG